MLTGRRDRSAVTGSSGQTILRPWASPALLADSSATATIYLPRGQSVACSFAPLVTKPVTAMWRDPLSGSGSAVAGGPFSGSHVFTPTGLNSGGDTDWLLELTAPPQLLNIVLQGNSILAGGGGVSAPYRPVTRIAAARPTAIVTDVSQGGVDAVGLRAAVANVTSLYVAGRRNIALLQEASNYLNDTRGEAAFNGDGLTLSDPNAAAAALYSITLSWVADVRAGGFEAWIVTSPNAYETTASPLSNNTQYIAAQDAFAALVRANPGQFDGICDAAADARMQNTANTTYFNPDRIHLSDGASGGSVVFSDLTIAPLPL